MRTLSGLKPTEPCVVSPAGLDNVVQKDLKGGCTSVELKELRALLPQAVGDPPDDYKYTHFLKEFGEAMQARAQGGGDGGGEAEGD